MDRQRDQAWICCDQMALRGTFSILYPVAEVYMNLDQLRCSGWLGSKEYGFRLRTAGSRE